MTPADYSAFRDALGKSSGFQSFQYRTLEYLIGNKNAAMIEVHRRTPAIYQQLHAALYSPSLYDEALRLLAAAALRCRRRTSSATGASLTRSTPTSRRPGCASIATPTSTGTCTNSPRNWSISTSASSCGGSLT